MHSSILLCGLAKTGTTILFTRIRDSLPPPVRTVFEPATAEALRGATSSAADTTVLAKALLGHIRDYPGEISAFTHRVQIVRDPRDQFVSEMVYDLVKFRQNKDDAGFGAARELIEQKVSDPASISCGELSKRIRSRLYGREMDYSQIAVSVPKYRELASFRQTFDPLVVRYEDIVDDHLEPLATYLGVDEIVQAEVDPAFSRVSRSNGYGEWRQWMTREDMEEFDREFQEVMELFGYAWEELPDQQIIPYETSIGYLDRLS